MKVSYSLPDATVAVAQRFSARFTGGNVSLVVDAALKYFAGVNGRVAEAWINRVRAERSATTRDAWMRVFWQSLALLFEGQDSNANPYAPRTYLGCLTVFLLKSMTEYPQENDGFSIYTAPSEMGMNVQPNTWTLQRDASPVDAAETVAKWIRDHATRPAA